VTDLLGPISAVQIPRWTGVFVPLVLLLIALPSTGATTSSSAVATLRAPFPHAVSNSFIGGGYPIGCVSHYHANGGGTRANKANGSIAFRDLRLRVVDCAYSGYVAANYYSWVGFWGMPFTVPTSGRISVISDWSGLLWLNMTIHPNGSAPGLLSAKWNISVQTGVGLYNVTSTYVVSSGTLNATALHLRIKFDHLPALTVAGLKPGQPETLFAQVRVGQIKVISYSTSPGGFVSATLHASPDFRLVKVVVT
jgi:hypothetical protein